MGLIVQPQAGIDQYKPLAGFNQQTGFHFSRPAGIAGETVEQVNGYGGVPSTDSFSVLIYGKF
jgi:hypothetical protein